MTVAHLQELLMVITIFHWVGEQPVVHLLAIAVTLATLCLAMTESPVSMVTGMMQRPDVGKWIRTFSCFKNVYITRQAMIAFSTVQSSALTFIRNVILFIANPNNA